MSVLYSLDPEVEAEVQKGEFHKIDDEDEHIHELYETLCIHIEVHIHIPAPFFLRHCMSAPSRFSNLKTSECVLFDMS